MSDSGVADPTHYRELLLALGAAEQERTKASRDLKLAEARAEVAAIADGAGTGSNEADRKRNLLVALGNVPWCLDIDLARDELMRAETHLTWAQADIDCYLDARRASREDVWRELARSGAMEVVR